MTLHDSTLTSQRATGLRSLGAEGIGHIVAQLGNQIGPCGISSLAATRDWLGTDMAKAFMRAYTKTRI
jgi:NitT/TauT family transport system substrate-binding protein